MDNDINRSSSLGSEDGNTKYENAKNVGGSVRKVFLSVIAAVIGAVCGSLPLLIEIFIKGKTSHFLFILIPLAITFFMVTFKGWRGKAAFIITLIFSVAGIFFVNFILFKSSSSFSGVWEAFKSESFYSYIFVLIGSAIGYEFLTSDKINPQATVAP